MNEADSSKRQPPPGWYDDSNGVSLRQRYWDGARWTEQFRELPPPPGAPVEPRAARPGFAGKPVRRSRRYRLGAACFILLLIAAVAPWQRELLLGLTLTGLDGAPVLMVPALILAGAGMYLYDQGRQDRRRRVGWLLIASGLVALLMVAGDFSKVSSQGSDVKVGWGALIGALAGAGLGVCGIWVLLRPPLVAANTEVDTSPRHARG